MVKNKRGSHYRILEIDGVMSAVLPGCSRRNSCYNDVAECREAIDKDNAFRQKAGLPVKHCVIALFYWERNYNPDGTFKELIETTTAIETYPAP